MLIISILTMLPEMLIKIGSVVLKRVTNITSNVRTEVRAKYNLCEEYKKMQVYEEFPVKFFSDNFTSEEENVIDENIYLNIYFYALV